MINLIFSINREIFRIEINNREIWYGDRKWARMIRLIPKDEEFLKKMRISRNRIPYSLISLFELTEKEMNEYKNAKDDETLANLCIKDAQMKGAKLLKKENANT